jgi:hypothetical protein
MKIPNSNPIIKFQSGDKIILLLDFAPSAEKELSENVEYWELICSGLDTEAESTMTTQIDASLEDSLNT